MLVGVVVSTSLLLGPGTGVAGADSGDGGDSAALAQAKARESSAAAAVEGSTAAVQAAGVELDRVSAQLPVAQQAVAVAKGQLAGARAKAAAARAEAAQAEAARAQAAVEVDAADATVARSRGQVASLARLAYQRGQLGDLHDVLSATQPDQAVERADLLRSVFAAGTASLDRVTTARLALSARRADLVVQEKAATAARQRADEEETHAQQLEQASEAAVAQVASLVAQRKQVLDAAQQQKSADDRAYQQAQADSRALAEKIRQAQAAAAARAAAAAAAARQAAAAAAAAAARAGRSAPPPPAVVTTPSSTGWLWPADGPLTSPFGWRMHPIFHVMRFHAGIDIGASYGAPTHASKAGTVIYAGDASGYGTLIVIDHGGGIATAYAHQSALLVSVGDSVSRGQVIGRVGNEGNSTGPHLHFEVRVNGEVVDPLGYVHEP